MKWLLVLVCCALLSNWAVVKAKKANNGKGNRATGSVEWCYHLPSCNYTTWPTIAKDHCGGSRQSPIDIVSASATGDSSLGAFTFNNYNSNSTMTKIENTGKTVKVALGPGVSISGGGLADPYDSLQFHLHWGNGYKVGGSEHTVDGMQYPMELHIVNAKGSYSGNTGQAIQDSTGLAALGFFIEAMSGNETASPASWKTLTDYLAKIEFKGNSTSIAAGISLDDLLSGVDRTKYYRYLGSLTTPTCNEAVVWTVFKEPIKVSKDLIDLFSTTLRVGSDTTTDLMTLTFRGVQAAQPVTTQASGSSKTCFSLGLMALCLLLIWSA